MRLTSHEITTIKQIIMELDPNARIYLFGSRVDNTKRGGDIDILALSSTLVLRDKLKIRFKLKDILGNRKIDIIITPKPVTHFTKVALKEGVLL